MKNVLLLACFLLLTGFSQAQIKDGSYPLLLTESLITWNVDFSIGTRGHAGTLTLISGNVTIKQGRIQGGNFVIDMNSVHVTDLKPDDGGKDLEEHLRGTDFLSTTEFPKGYFTILKSEPAAGGKLSISGYLIMKGISNTVIIPSIVTESKTGILVKSELTVNRTLWGINYQSGIIGTLKNDAISDDIKINLTLAFRKPQ